MYELKFKNFDFRNFMDFVLNLADYYGLDEVKFSPDKREFFDEVQLCHISPSRNVEDKRGFVWAWMRSKEKVREVNFDQFSKDETKKINIVINLDNKLIKLNSIQGISRAILEDLIEKSFGGKLDISDIKIEKLQIKVGILEFTSTLFFALCFTLIFAMSKILNVTYYWKPLSQYFIEFFVLALLIVYIILPIIEIIKKVGVSCKKIFSEVVAEFKRATTLNKIVVVLTVAGVLLGLISLVK